MMRFIIEVETDSELERIASLLQAEMFKDLPITIQKNLSPRQVRLKEIFRKYHGRLPDDWRFDREAAHER